ncbi:MAG: cation-transporting P-type ATPase, partial [Pseudomonadota bacterium]
MTTQSWHSMEVNAVLTDLKVDPLRGLAPEEAGTRLIQYGPNELTHEEKASPWALFFNQFKNILIIILIIAT